MAILEKTRWQFCTQIIKHQILNILSIIAIVFLSLLSIICIVNSFAGHITPDLSIYLLHARTFIEELNRFTASHDSKGIMLTFILSLPVRIFGPNIIAAAFIQLCAHIAGFICIFYIIQSYTSKITSLIIALLGLCLVYSYHIWGGNARPENFGLAFTVVALYSASQKKNKFLAVSGAMAACCLFIKTTLIITPIVIILSAIIANTFARRFTANRKLYIGAGLSLIGDLLWAFLGFAVVSIFVLGWVLIFDDIRGLYHQTVQWPMNYREQVIELNTTFQLIRNTGLIPLFLIGLGELIIGWIRGFKRDTILVVSALVAELSRISIEGGRWYYLPTIIIPLLLIGAGMYGTIGLRKTKFTFIGIILVFLFAPLLGEQTSAEIRAIDLRIINRYPSPYEYLAKKLKKLYSPSEYIFIATNDYQLLLLLEAPRPIPILPCHFAFASAEEQMEIRQHYINSPPEWIIKPVSPPAGSAQRILGGVDYAYYVQVAEKSDSMLQPVPENQENSGQSLFRALPASEKYRLEIDTGYFQAWRLISIEEQQT